MGERCVEMFPPDRNHDAMPDDGQSWFVYLLALADYSAFKVGFSCHPLQRIYSFSRRYFEYFDLGQSRLLRLGACDDARAIEATLKKELAEFRADSPSWIARAAGGHTEWFSAVYFGQAEERLQSFLQIQDVARLSIASDYIRDELGRLTPSFEQWAWSLAQQVGDVLSSVSDAHMRAEAARSLRDWLDAYRHFDLPLFADDPPVLKFVADSARLTGR